MRAMMLRETGTMGSRDGPLNMVEIADLHPANGQLRIRVHACGVCHTDLDEIEGRLRPSALPRILGHQVVGTVDEIGSGTTPSWLGVRVGVPWLFRTCGACEFCVSGRENLCSRFVGTGCDVDGGYASLMLACPDFVHPIPNGISDVQAAPLLCAGAIGVRALRMAGLSNGEPLGLMGFGASGHLVLAVARFRYPDSRISVFARSSDERTFAVQSGAQWVGDTDDQPPEPLVAIIDTTPAWAPVVGALGRLRPGGRPDRHAIRRRSRDRTVSSASNTRVIYGARRSS